MTLALEQIAVPLRKDADGVVRVGATRVTLDTIVRAYQDGAMPEQIAQQYPAVTLAEIYATIAYYLSHATAVRAYLDEREKLAAKVRTKIEANQDMSGIRDRLMARRNKERASTCPRRELQ